MNIDEKILNLAKKVNQLSKKGVDGEKKSASEKLDLLMTKYGITWEMLESETKTQREFLILGEQRRFFNQVVSSVCGGDAEVYFNKLDNNKKKKRFYVTMSDIDFIEVSEKFNFYWEKYQEDLKVFYSAFIQNNHLYRKRTEDDDSESEDVSPDERERLLKVVQMMKGMDRHTMQKRLSN